MKNPNNIFRAPTILQQHSIYRPSTQQHSIYWPCATEISLSHCSSTPYTGHVLRKSPYHTGATLHILAMCYGNPLIILQQHSIYWPCATEISLSYCSSTPYTGHVLRKSPYHTAATLHILAMCYGNPPIILQQHSIYWPCATEIPILLQRSQNYGVWNY